jgi:HEAT repeat protein
MKMKVLRHLLFPWVLLFTVIIAVMVMTGVRFHVPEKFNPYVNYCLGVGIFLCLVSNFNTLSKAGIWIAHSLPSSLRRSPWGWILRAFFAAGVAGGFYLMGQLSWIPLIWQAAVIPIVAALCLFVIVRSLMGPILSWSSQIAFSRFTAFVLGIPVFALVPITAIFLGHMVVNAYVASRPEMPPAVLTAAIAAEQASNSNEQTAVAEKEHEAPESEEAKTFYELATSGKSCADSNKEVQNALNPNGHEEVVYWAIKAVKCTEMKSVVGLPKLAKIMTDHPSAKVRAAAIMAMPKFGIDNVKRIGYLLVKRIAEKEPSDVIEAAASVLTRLGEDERKWAHRRLKGLLDSPKASGAAAKVLVDKLKNGEIVSEYVSEHLPESGEPRARAISMICALPDPNRKAAEPYIEKIVESIKTGSEDDPAIVALGCLGNPGFQAIRQEVTQPQHLDRPVAARALAEMDIKDNTKDALETAKNCAQDKDATVRKWCSQALGELGAPALPQILDLLKSNNSALKDAGQHALNFFNDPVAKQELFRVRAENSGWMANQKKLQIAKAVDTALLKIVTEEAQGKPAHEESESK